jgi:hypothetical protein
MIHSCLILVAVSGLSLGYFLYLNKNRKIERYYYRENKLLFALLTFINFILAITLVMNSRHLFSEFTKMFFMNFQFFKDLAKWKADMVKKAYA